MRHSFHSPDDSEPTTKPFDEATPEEVKHIMRERVAKSVAAVTGAMQGFIDGARNTPFVEGTQKAVSRMGRTARQVGHAAKDELDRVRGKPHAHAPHYGHEHGEPPHPHIGQPKE